MGTGGDRTSVEFLTQRVQLLHWIVLLCIVVNLFLIVSLVYDFLSFISTTSIVAILAFTTLLSAAGFFISKISSERAIRTVSQYSERLNALLRTSKDLHEIDYSDLLLENIMEIALEMTHAQAGALHLMEKGNLIVKMAKGGTAADRKGRSIPRSQGIAGWVLEHSRTVRLDDAEQDERFAAEIDGITSGTIRSLLCVPLRLREGTIGTLAVVNRETGTFTDEDQELILYFADQAALSIEKAIHYEDQTNYEIHLTAILTEAIENLSGKAGHARNVARYALMMADAIGMTEERKKILYRAAILHDIGFLKVRPDEVLALEEFQAHVEFGYELLSPITSYADITSIVLHHHERYDGTGYPKGLKGEDIPIASRIIGIAEAFDSMVNRHSYKSFGTITNGRVMNSVVEFEQAVEELHAHTGTQFDPRLVAAFVERVGPDDLASD